MNILLTLYSSQNWWCLKHTVHCTVYSTLYCTVLYSTLYSKRNGGIAQGQPCPLRCANTDSCVWAKKVQMPAKCKWIQTQTATLETNKLITSRGAMPCRLFLKLKPFADLFGLLALYVLISLFLEKGWKYFCRDVFFCFTLSYNTIFMNKLKFND